MSAIRLRLHKGQPAPGGVPAPTGNARFVQSAVSPTAVTAPVAGERLYIDPGPFTNTPTSYDYTVYSAGVAVATGTFTSPYDAFWVVPDASLTEALQVKCHAINGSGTSASTSDSIATSAVAQIDFTDNVPVFTRTSASGVTPMTGNVTFGGGIDVLAGDTVLFQVFANQANAEAGTPVSREAQLILEEGDLPSLDIRAFNSRGIVTIGSSPWTDMAATEVGWLRLQTVGEMGSFFSGFSTLFSPTNLAAGDAVFDNFDDNFLDTSKWQNGNVTPNCFPVSGGTISETSGITRVRAADGVANYCGRMSVNKTAFSGKWASFDRQDTEHNNGNDIRYLFIGADMNTGYCLYLGGGNANICGISGGTNNFLTSGTDPDSTVTGAPVSARSWRLRHDSATDTIKAEYAPASAPKPPGAGDWVTLLSVARSNTYWNGSATCYAGFGSGNWSGAASNVNVDFNDFDTSMAL